MNSSLLRELSPDFFAITEKLNLKIINEHQETAFGNALVEIEADAFDMRLIRDRGHVYIDISPKKGQGWRSLNKVLSYISDQDSPNDLGKLSIMLCETWDEVSALMLGDLNCLDAFIKRTSQTLIDEIFPGS